MKKVTLTVASDFALLQALRGAVWIVFPAMLQTDFGVGIGAGIEYVLRSALEGESGLPMTALRQSECPAADAVMRRVSVWFQLCRVVLVVLAAACGEDFEGLRSSACGQSIRNCRS